MMPKPKLTLPKEIYIAFLSLGAIATYLVLRFSKLDLAEYSNYPLIATLIIGGLPLIFDLLVKVRKGEFGSDLLAGISIVTSVILGEYLAGTLVVLMLSGGEALEEYALSRASSVLSALARRMPETAHKLLDGKLLDVRVSELQIDDTVLVLPHEICPVDGLVVDGHGSMDESFLTGEPFRMQKIAGAFVISGAINGDVALTVRATKLPKDSRYARVMKVMEESERNRPHIRRLGDKLGAFYTPLAVVIGVIAWAISGDPVRFLSVMVVATPCPLIIGIPVAIIGTISLCARRGILVRSPEQLEEIDSCKTVIFDKTGTLTYGKPSLTEVLCNPNQIMSADTVLRYAASLEQFSKHPLAFAVLEKARELKLQLLPTTTISERPGEGLLGSVGGKQVFITGRNQLAGVALPPQASGLECVVMIDGGFAALFRFHDAPRAESKSFIEHLSTIHGVQSVMLLSGDRESEVKYFAEQVGIKEHYYEQSPEDKLNFVRAQTGKAKTIFVGDGINDVPALLAATVGIAIGQHNEVTIESAGAVIMEPSLRRLDEFFHISRQMRKIALQSAVGGMVVSILGMFLAMAGILTPVWGAIAQEIIDLASVLNALRASFPPEKLSDFDE